VTHAAKCDSRENKLAAATVFAQLKRKLDQIRALQKRPTQADLVQPNWLVRAT
jgi:hypothetical protein